MKNQLVIAGLRVIFHPEGNTGQFGDHQLTGGIDDAAHTEMTANGGQILPGQGNVQMASLGTDGAVETDDLAVVGDLTDCDTAGIPDFAF